MSQYSYAEALIPSVTVCADTAFREVFKVNEVMTVGPNLIGLVPLYIRRGKDISSCTEKMPCENTVRRDLTRNQFYQHLNLGLLGSSTMTK